MLQQILTSHHIQMAFDLRILTRKAVDLVLAEAAAEPRVELAGQLVVEFGQQFGVEEEIGGCGEFGGDSVEEDLRAVVFGGAGAALFGFYGEDAQFKDVDAVAQKDGFAAYMVLVWPRLCVMRFLKIGGRRENTS